MDARPDHECAGSRGAQSRAVRGTPRSVLERAAEPAAGGRQVSAAHLFPRDAARACGAVMPHDRMPAWKSAAVMLHERMPAWKSAAVMPHERMPAWKSTAVMP